jgi:hypothetical protein
MCTDAYREALIRALSSTVSSAPTAAGAAAESSLATPPAQDATVVTAEVAGQH